MVDPLLELHSLKDVVDGFSRNVDFSNHKLRKTFVVFLTTNSLNDDLDIYSLTNWRSVFLSLLSMKVSFKAIVYICHQFFLTIWSSHYKKKISWTTSLLNMSSTRFPRRKFLY
jgi:hypothetical protein